MADYAPCPYCGASVPLLALEGPVRCSACQRTFQPVGQEHVQRAPLLTPPMPATSIKEVAPREYDDDPRHGWERPTPHERSILRVFPPTGHGKATAARILLAVCCVLYLVAGIMAWNFAAEVERIAFGFVPDFNEFLRLDRQERTLGVVFLAGVGLFLITGIVYLTWLYNAYANLDKLGVTSLQFTPGWAVGYHFIPIIGLVRPYQVMQEIWRGSEPEAAYSWGGRRGSGTILFWWLVFLASGFLALRFRMVTRDRPTLPDVISAYRFEAFSCFATVLAGVLLITIISGVVNRQDTKYALLRENAEYGAEDTGSEQHDDRMDSGTDSVD